MSLPAAILMYGRDLQLSDTRRMVLEAAGYKVAAAWEMPEIGRMLSSTHFDLLILCHTLSKEDCGRAVASAMLGNRQ